VRPVITTPRAINQAIAKHYAPGARNEAAELAADKPGKKKSSSGEKAKAKARAVKLPFEQLPPEEQQHRKQVGYIALCWSVIFGMLPQILNMTGITPTGTLFGLGWWSCAAISIVLAGGVYAWLALKYWK
jgi:hypothetical protein